jgi:hypothetical protein
MKRSLFLGVIIGIVFSLALPFHSMAANLSVQTLDGFTIILDKPILGASIDANGNQIVLINSPHDQLPLQQLEPMITISGATANNTTATVTGAKGDTVTFNILATDTAGTPKISYLGPIITGETPFGPDPANPSAKNMGQFSKKYNAAGTYQVVFGAITANTVTSELDSTQRSIAIVITDPQACTSTVTAVVNNPAGGSVTSTNPVTTNCTGSVTFSGQLASGYTGATVTEGTFTPPTTGLIWNLTNITPPTTNGGSKTVSITFTTGSPPPPNGWISLNFQIGSTNFYGYNASVGGHFFGPVSGGQTYSFLIDPLSVNNYVAPTIMVGDVSQAVPCSPHLYMLDSANNTILELPMDCGNNQCSNSWPKTVRYNMERLLLTITPSSGIQSMYVYWF